MRVTPLHNHIQSIRIVRRAVWLIPLGVAGFGIAYSVLGLLLVSNHSLGPTNFLISVWFPLFMLLVFIGLMLKRLADTVSAELIAQHELVSRYGLLSARSTDIASRRAFQLETASALGQQTTATQNLDTLLSRVVTFIRDKFDYYLCSIFLVDEASSEVVLKTASGSEAEGIVAQGLRLKIGQEGIIGHVAQTGKCFLCNDVAREPQYYSARKHAETKAELAVPLCVAGRVIGVLDIQNNRTDSFDQEDITFLQILGNQIGVVFENARLFQETKYRYDAMVALHSISLDIVAQLDTPQLLDALVQRGAQLLGAESGGLVLYDPEKEYIHTAASHNTRRDWTRMPLPKVGVLGHVIRTGQPMIVNDYPNWPARRPRVSGEHHLRVVGVPLKWENQVIGVLDVLTSNPQSRFFNEDDLWLLSQFADLATIAIKNAELHSRTRQFSQELEQTVEARTWELSRAKQEIAERSEQLRLLLSKTMQVQEDERARIARDMHDSVIQLVTAARFELEAAGSCVREDSKTGAQEKLAAGHELLDEIERQIRRAILNLHPPSLDAAGLTTALGNYLESFERFSGIGCRIQVHGSVVRLPIQVEGSIYRMLVEALTNVVTHAEASQVFVELNYQPEQLDITVDDNGCGFDWERWDSESQHPGGHLGLLGMQERIRSLGGTMYVGQAPDCGTRLCFRLPIPEMGAEWT